MITNSKIDYIQLFTQYMEFLQKNPELDITAFYNKYQIFLKDEKAKLENYFQKTITLTTFESFDINKILEFLQDWYISIKVISRQVKESKNPYYAESYFLDNMIRSLGIDFIDLLLPEVKPDFSQDIVKLYKIKGTTESIRKALAYFFLIPIEIYEMWLQKQDNDIVFKGKSNRINFIKNTYFDIDITQKYEEVTKNDPHWYYSKDQILNLLDTQKISLPSLSPYIKVVTAPDLQFFYVQLMQLIRNCHFIYNYQINGGNLDNYKLLTHPDLEIPLSILEIFLGYTYLYNTINNRSIDISDISKFMYSNVINTDYNKDDYSDLELNARKFEYDKLKAEWLALNIRPHVPEDISSVDHGYIKEDNTEYTKINRTRYKKITVFSETYPFTYDYLIDPAVASYNGYIIVSGGKHLDSTYNTSIKFYHGEHLTSEINSGLTLPFNLSGHAMFKIGKKLIIYGGRKSDGVINAKIYKYKYNLSSGNDNENWSSEVCGFNWTNFKAIQLSNEYILNILGYNSSGNLVKDKFKLLDADKNEVINIPLNTLFDDITTNYTESNRPTIDYDFNGKTLIIAFKEEDKIYIIDLIDSNGNVKHSITTSDWWSQPISSGISQYQNKPCRILIDNSDRIFVVYENTLRLLGGSITKFSNNIDIIEKGYKVKLNNKYVILFGEQNDSYVNKVQKAQLDYNFIHVNDYDLNSQMVKASNGEKIIFEENKPATFVRTYDQLSSYTQRRIIKEKLSELFRNYSSDKFTYLYKDVYINPDNETEIIEGSLTNVLKTNSDILNYINDINNELKLYLENSTQELPEEQNRRLFIFANLIDLYIRLFWRDIGYFTQLILNSDKTINKIIDTFKPIMTRYFGITTCFNMKYDFTNALYSDDVCINIPVENVLEDINVKEDFKTQFTMDIYDIPYIPPSTYKFDASSTWRNEFFDLQENAIMKVGIIEISMFISLIDKIYVNYGEGEIPKIDENLSEESFDYIRFTENLDIQVIDY